MKINELIKEGLDDFDLDTIQRRGKDSADDDDAGLDHTKTPPMSARLLRATDVGDTIKTDDGKSFKVSKARASIIRDVLTDMNRMKAPDREKLDDMLKKSENFKKVMEPKDKESLEAVLMSMVGDFVKPEPSNY